MTTNNNDLYRPIGHLIARADTFHDFSSKGIRCVLNSIEQQDDFIERVLNTDSNVFNIIHDNLYMIGNNIINRPNHEDTFTAIIQKHFNDSRMEFNDGGLLSPIDLANDVLVNVDDNLFDTLHQNYGTRLGLVLDQGDYPQGIFTDPMAYSLSDSNHKCRINLNMIASNWDQANRSHKYKVCVNAKRRLDNASNSSNNVYMNTPMRNIKYMSSEMDMNFCQAKYKNKLESLVNTLMINGECVIDNIHMMNDIVSCGVHSLCEAINELTKGIKWKSLDHALMFEVNFQSLNNVCSKILFNNPNTEQQFIAGSGSAKITILKSFILSIFRLYTKEKIIEGTTTIPLAYVAMFLFDVKRSMDYGQVEMVKELNNNFCKSVNPDQLVTHKVFNEKKAEMKYVPPNIRSIVFDKVILLTGDRLCYLKAKHEGVPTMFLRVSKNKSALKQVNLTNVKIDFAEVCKLRFNEAKIEFDELMQSIGRLDGKYDGNKKLLDQFIDGFILNCKDIQTRHYLIPQSKFNSTFVDHLEHHNHVMNERDTLFSYYNTIILNMAGLLKNAVTFLNTGEFILKPFDAQPQIVALSDNDEKNIDQIQKFVMQVKAMKAAAMYINGDVDRLMDDMGLKQTLINAVIVFKQQVDFLIKCINKLGLTLQLGAIPNASNIQVGLDDSKNHDALDSDQLDPDNEIHDNVLDPDNEIHVNVLDPDNEPTYDDEQIDQTAFKIVETNINEALLSTKKKHSSNNLVEFIQLTKEYANTLLGKMNTKFDIATINEISRMTAKFKRFNIDASVSLRTLFCKHQVHRDMNITSICNDFIKSFTSHLKYCTVMHAQNILGSVDVQTLTSKHWVTELSQKQTKSFETNLPLILEIMLQKLGINASYINNSIANIMEESYVGLTSLFCKNGRALHNEFTKSFTGRSANNNKVTNKGIPMICTLFNYSEDLTNVFQKKTRNAQTLSHAVDGMLDSGILLSINNMFDTVLISESHGGGPGPGNIQNKVSPVPSSQYSNVTNKLHEDKSTQDQTQMYSPSLGKRQQDDNGEVNSKRQKTDSQTAETILEKFASRNDTLLQVLAIFMDAIVYDKYNQDSVLVLQDLGGDMQSNLSFNESYNIARRKMNTSFAVRRFYNRILRDIVNEITNPTKSEFNDDVLIARCMKQTLQNWFISRKPNSNPILSKVGHIMCFGDIDVNPPNLQPEEYVIDGIQNDFVAWGDNKITWSEGNSSMADPMWKDNMQKFDNIVKTCDEYAIPISMFMTNCVFKSVFGDECIQLEGYNQSAGSKKKTTYPYKTKDSHRAHLFIHNLFKKIGLK
jgi:hypothetical protein